MLRIRVTRPQAGQALIEMLGADNAVTNTHLETDATKADAMTNALENAPGGSLLGVIRGPGL